MGVRTGFLLVAGIDPPQVIEQLGMRLGAVVHEPDTDEPDRTPALGPVLNGWTLIVDQPLQLLLDKRVLSRLSRGATLVTLVLNEIVMYSDASGHEDGQERWWVASGDPRDWRLAWPKPRVRWWRRLVGDPPGPVEAAGER
jgi:hypothetical protein